MHMMHRLHSWNVSYKKAVEIQKSLQNRIKLISLSKKPHLIAGVDVSYNNNTRRMYAAIVVFTWPQLFIIESVTANMTTKFPYIPGLLSFREGPVLIKAFKKLKNKVDLAFFDGQGLAHPRGLGIASHLGLWLNCPAIGCAKSRLVGTYKEPGKQKGSWSKLIYKEKIVGTVLRTRTDIKPIFVSVGHKITLRQAIKYVLDASSRYRIPEPTRQAHILCNSIKENK